MSLSEAWPFIIGAAVSWTVVGYMVVALYRDPARKETKQWLKEHRECWCAPKRQDNWR